MYNMLIIKSMHACIFMCVYYIIECPSIRAYIKVYKMQVNKCAILLIIFYMSIFILK